MLARRLVRGGALWQLAHLGAAPLDLVESALYLQHRGASSHSENTNMFIKEVRRQDTMKRALAMYPRQ